MTPIEKLKKLSKLVCEKCLHLIELPTQMEVIPDTPINIPFPFDYSVCQTCPIHQLINELMEEIK